MCDRIGGKLINEIWKPCPIKEFEDFYEVSSLGRVRSVDRVVTYNNGREVYYKGKILKPQQDKDFYEKVSLCKNGKEIKVTVHKLVALAFIGENTDGKVINHKNCFRNDNRVENLEWCTPKYNTEYAYREGYLGIGDKHPKAQKYIVIKENTLVSYYTCRSRLGDELKYSSKNISKFVDKNLKLYDVFTIKTVEKFPRNEVNINLALNLNDYEGVFSPTKIIDKKGNILGIYSNLKICSTINTKFNFGTLQKRSQDKGLYMNKYYIIHISKYEYLTSNKDLINAKI